MTDTRRSGTSLLKATVPRTMKLSMNPGRNLDTSLDLRRGAARFFFVEVAIGLRKKVEEALAYAKHFCTLSVSVR